MRADVTLSEDTTTLHVRWEVVIEAGEAERLSRMQGSLALRVEASSYVDDGGKYHEHAEIDVPVFPHAGRHNRGQAKFRDHEARRRFVENLQEGVTVDVAGFLWDGDPEAVGPEGEVIERAEWALASRDPS